MNRDLTFFDKSFALLSRVPRVPVGKEGAADRVHISIILTAEAKRTQRIFAGLNLTPQSQIADVQGEVCAEGKG